jgi:protein-L-isoaspartate(D-aspartate) O-methyltransferase
MEKHLNRESPQETNSENLLKLEQWQHWRDMPNYKKHAFLLEKRGYLNNERLRRAFSEVDRGDFLHIEDSFFSLADVPIGIGYEQTNSQPSLVASMLDRLDPNPGQTILDVGVGSGWTSALLSYVVGRKGKVVGTERIPELLDFAKENISKYPISNVSIHLAGDILGRPEDGPYDRILVSASSLRVPKELSAQLKIGGKMVVPTAKRIKLVTRLSEDEFDSKIIARNTKFVPLVKGPASLS